MKSYTPQKLVAVSRYRKFFPTLPEEIRHDVYLRMKILLRQRKLQAYRADSDLHRSVSVFAGPRQNRRGSLSDCFHRDVEGADAGYLSETGQAFLVPSGDEKNPSFRVSAWIRYGLEILMASG